MKRCFLLLLPSQEEEKEEEEESKTESTATNHGRIEEVATSYKESIHVELWLFPKDRGGRLPGWVRCLKTVAHEGGESASCMYVCE